MTRIPEEIRRLIGDRPCTPEDIGCSGAKVFMYDDMVLKIQPECSMAANEHHMLRWLQGKLPVPELLAEAYQDGNRWLLMSRMPGRYLCSADLLDDQPLLAELCAQSLRRLWEVDPDGCPTDRTNAQKFREIEQGLREGRFTKENSCQPELYEGPEGFASPAALFDWLVAHCPEEQKVLSHGDLCLPNIFAQGRSLTGYIDVGLAGIADKWVDIEKCLWSMWANTTGFFGGVQRPFDRRLLFDALGMEPDEDRLCFYSRLDALA